MFPEPYAVAQFASSVVSVHGAQIPLLQSSDVPQAVLSAVHVPPSLPPVAVPALPPVAVPPTPPELVPPPPVAPVALPPLPPAPPTDPSLPPEPPLPLLPPPSSPPPPQAANHEPRTNTTKTASA